MWCACESGSLGGCYEINISDPHATTPTGGIVGVHSPLPYRVKSAGKWSRFDVLADGPHLVVKVNGETLTDARDEKLRDGAIGLQAGGPTGLVRSSSATSGFGRYGRPNRRSQIMKHIARHPLLVGCLSIAFATGVFAQQDFSKVEIKTTKLAGDLYTLLDKAARSACSPAPRGF